MMQANLVPNQRHSVSPFEGMSICWRKQRGQICISQWVS